MYAEGTGRYQALTREDSHQIQRIMNVVLRSLTKLSKDTPIRVLLESSGFLSFHQICAYFTINTAHRIIQNKEPTRLYQALLEHKPTAERPRRQEFSQSRYNLSIFSKSFLYQAAKLYYSLPKPTQNLESPKEFKKKTRICGSVLTFISTCIFTVYYRNQLTINSLQQPLRPTTLEKGYQMDSTLLQPKGGLHNAGWPLNSKDYP